jgi:hypothetical protein
MVLHQSDRAWAVHFLVTGSVQVLFWVGDEDLLGPPRTLRSLFHKA